MIIGKLKNNEKYKHMLIGFTLAFLLLACVGVTYSWFNAITEGEGNRISIKSKELKLIYTDPLVVNAPAIEPGWKLTKTFTVENTTDEEKYYKIVWSDLINTFETDYLTIEMSSTNVGGEILKSPITKSSVASEVSIIDAVTIAGKTTQTYTVTFEYANTEADQTADMGKQFSGSIELYLLDSKPGDVNVLAYTCSTCETMPSSFPLKGQGYSVNTITCTNGATAVWDNVDWGPDIQNMTGPTNCTVDFEEIPTLAIQILNDNTNVSTRTSFGSAFTTSNNGNTIYSAAGQDNKTTYYFAGNVTNNYVYFANKYWRIVRINEDNSVRLIYAGTSVTDTAGFSSTSQAFNTSYDSSVYVGYKYTSGTQYGLDTNSPIKTHLDSWYTSNLNSDSTVDSSGNKFDKYISRTAIYCNDRKVGSGTWSSSGSTVYYAAYTRLYSNKKPTFTCSELNDRFTTSTTTGNGRLYNASGVASPIATITADEVAYAGGLFGTNNTSYYIYQNASSGASFWWTMSPHSLLSSRARVWRVGGANSSSSGNLHSDDVYNTFGVRPVVSLKSCVQWDEGNGTTSQPYKVRISESCISTDN